MARILAIDDEADVLVLIEHTLEQIGHQVKGFSDPALVNTEQLRDYDLILLDVMMPGVDGVEFCQHIRSLVDCPILFLTAKTGEAHVVAGLMAGGDDYITKPFGVQELQARVEAHLRREQREKHLILHVSGVRFDLSAKEVSIDGQVVPLTKSEYEICEFLARHRGQVFSREQIYDAVYGYAGESEPSTISEHVKNIRAKFLQKNLSPIGTVWGIGYKWI